MIEWLHQDMCINSGDLQNAGTVALLPVSFCFHNTLFFGITQPINMMKIICLALFVSMASAGVVTPVEPCGGNGTPVQLRIQGCEGEPPCLITPNADTRVEGDFIPRENSALAHFRLVAETSMGVIPVVDQFVGALTGGQLYSAGQTIRISDALSGQDVVAILDVYDVASGRVELCVKAPIHVA